MCPAAGSGAGGGPVGRGRALRPAAGRHTSGDALVADRAADAGGRLTPSHRGRNAGGRAVLRPLGAEHADRGPAGHGDARKPIVRPLQRRLGAGAPAVQDAARAMNGF